MGLQDSSFRYSHFVSPKRMFLLYFSWIPVFAACAASSFFLVQPLWTKLNLKSDPTPAAVAVFVITLIGAISIIVRYARKQAYVSLNEQEWAL